MSKDNKALIDDARVISEKMIKLGGEMRSVAMSADEWICELQEENSKLRKERDRLKAQINGMKQAIDDLVRNSEGVTGLHQNGEMAPWDELLTGGRFEEWLAVFDEMPEQSLAARDAEVIENLQFPTVFRKMWSGSEVQAWLNEEANLIRQQAKESQHE